MKRNEIEKHGAVHPASTTELLDVVETLKGLERCSRFSAAVEEGGLKERLSGTGPFTLLAPLNTYFEKLPKNFFSFLSRKKHHLVWFVNLHLIADKVNKQDLGDMQVVKTVSGEFFETRFDGQDVRIDDSRIVEWDIMCSNGILHVLGGVLWPK